MEGLGLGAGIAALAFWGFVACAVLATTWNTIRKREAQHETVRRLIESGKPLDGELMDKLLAMGEGGSGRPDRDFKVTGLWLLPVAVGLLSLGLILGSQVPEALAPILGAGALCGTMGVGCLIAGWITGRWYATDEDPGRERLGI